MKETYRKPLIFLYWVSKEDCITTSIGEDDTENQGEWDTFDH